MRSIFFILFAAYLFYVAVNIANGHSNNKKIKAGAFILLSFASAIAAFIMILLGL